MKFQDPSVHASKVTRGIIKCDAHTDKPKAICHTNIHKKGFQYFLFLPSLDNNKIKVAYSNGSLGSAQSDQCLHYTLDGLLRT